MSWATCARCWSSGLARGEAALREVGGALEVALGVLELRLVLRLLRLRLVERGLERARVDLRQQVARLHVLALGERDLHQLPVDARADRHGVVGLDRADAVEPDRHVLPLGGRHRHRHPLAAARRLALLLAGGRAAVEQEARHRGERQGGQAEAS